MTFTRSKRYLFHRALLWAGFLAIALAAVGCVTPALPPVGPVVAASPEDYLARSQQIVQTEGSRNLVLNQMRVGTVALGLKQYDLATQAFDSASQHVLGIYANNPSAAKARKLWYEEATKDFKGEPYERAMALFFRGLLYYQEADYDNARACFRSAQFQDALAEEDQNRCDFVVMDWLEALCNARLGQMDNATDVLKHAREIQRPIPTNLPDIHPDSNVLFSIFLGSAPVKQNTGRHGERLSIVPGQTNISGAKIKLDGQSFQPEWVFDSVSYQATTRGGRAIDFIQGRKATYKTAGQTVAGVGEVAGAGLVAYGLSEDKKDVAAVGAGVLAAGILADVASAQIRTQADIRAWDTLPDAMIVSAARLEPGKHAMEVIYTDGAGDPLFEQPQRVEFEVPPAPAKNTVVTAWSHPPQRRYVELPQ